MLTINDITNLFEHRYQGLEVTPEQIVEKLRAVIKTMDIFQEPDRVPIRISIGKPKEPTDKDFNDWEEEMCRPLIALPGELWKESYKVYEIWYDDDENEYGVEVMLYKE